MTQDEIIEMARQAANQCGHTIKATPEIVETLEAFAKLVAAKEREACAKVCEARYMGDNNREDMEARRCADAIRARGQE